MEDFKKNRLKILITGGAGFIGSHVVRLFVNKYPEYLIYNIDSLTYAGNLQNLRDIQDKSNYVFINGDINDRAQIIKLFEKEKFDSIIHLAAESHVDNSILNPYDFIYTNIIGTINLLEAFKTFRNKDNSASVFYHISTDEVYGSLGETGYFTENSSYDPRSPYSASKASSDHFVRSYGETYGIPYLISNCSNNYGENQFPEKLIPLFINNIINKKGLPVYGDGNYTRDWLYVKDHALAIDLIFHQSLKNKTYNVGGFNEWKNIDLVKLLCNLVDDKLGRDRGESFKLVKFVKDRPGHDKRYAIDASKITNDLGWKPKVSFEEGLSLTIDWYLQNKEWLNDIQTGNYRNLNKL